MLKVLWTKTQFDVFSDCTNQLLGVIYLGNDSITGLFTEMVASASSLAAQTAGILHTSLLLNELKTDNQALRQALETNNLPEYHRIIAPNA